MMPQDCRRPFGDGSPSQFNRSRRAPLDRWKCATGSRAVPFARFSVSRYRAAIRISGPFRASQSDVSVHQLRSEEHTSELQSLMRISYALFCLNKKTTKPTSVNTEYITKMYT